MVVLCSNIYNPNYVSLITILFFVTLLLSSKPNLERLEEFFLQFKPSFYKKGETILRAGDFPQGVLFLKKGYVRLFSISGEGKELTLVIYRPGEFFPVVWTFGGKRPSIYSFEALTACELTKVPREDFIDFIKNDIETFIDVTRHMISRFQIALRRMEYLTFGNSASRLASILLICAKEYSRKKSGEYELLIPFTHRDFANLVGVTRETISIELKKFERRGIVGRHGRRLVIKKKRQLEKEAILL